MVGGRSYRAVIACVFGIGLSVMGGAKTVVPAIHTRDFVAGIVLPARSPENRLSIGGGHNGTAVISHQRTFTTGLWIGFARPKGRFKSLCPVDAQHGRAIGPREILWS